MVLAHGRLGAHFCRQMHLTVRLLNLQGCQGFRGQGCQTKSHVTLKSAHCGVGGSQYVTISPKLLS